MLICTYLASLAGTESVQRGLQLSATSTFHVTTSGNLFRDVVLHSIVSNWIRKPKHLWVELNSLKLLLESWTLK